MSTFQILYILAYSGPAIGLIPLAVGLSRRRYMAPQHKPVLWLIVLTCLSDFTALALAIAAVPNWFMLPLSNLLYALPVFWLYSQLIAARHQRMWRVVAASYVVIQVLEVSFFTGLSAYTSISSTLLSVIFVVSSVVLIKSTVSKTSIVSRIQSSVYINVLRQPFFWFTLAILIYYGAKTPNAIIGHYASQHMPNLFYVSIGAGSVLLMIYKVILAIGLSKIPKLHHLNTLSISKHH